MFVDIGANKETTLTSHELDTWILEVAPRAVAYAASLLRDRGLAEDVVQECFWRLLNRADVYDLPRDGHRLLFRAITNRCINHNTRTRPKLSIHCGDEYEGDLTDCRGESPLESAMRSELEEAVAKGLEQLPMEQRAALELKALGHSAREIADALDVSVSYAGVMVHRARQALARHLQPFLEDCAG